MPRHAGFDPAVHVRRVQLDYPRHAREIERDAAAHGGHVALKAGARAERHDGDAVLVAQREQPRRLFRALYEGDSVGKAWRIAVLPVAVLLAQGSVGGNPLAEQVPSLGDHGIDGSRHGCPP